MTKPVTTKGGFVRVLLGDSADPIVYAAPCGFTQRSITLNKGLEEVNIPDCDSPESIDWLDRDATSLSMSVSGEGVLAQGSVATWVAAWKSQVSVPVKVEIEFAALTVTWTGYMQVESIEIGATNGQRVTLNVSMQSDGEMVEVIA